MKLLGFEIARRDGALSITKAAPQNLQSVASWGWNWLGRIHESFTGAWQKNVEVDAQPSLLAFSAVYACVTGIASDVAKMRIKLCRNVEGIWEEITENQPWLPLLRKPNHFQNRIKFVEQWIVSKLLTGNTYVLKERDARGIVNAMYVLNPLQVTPLVADDGSVWYRLGKDSLSQVEESDNVVPASEIIHDMMVSLFHPLVGVSPIYACGASATMGNKIQQNSTKFFANMSRPSGQLTAPGRITDEVAGRLKAAFETNFSGENIGRLFVAGDGLKFESFTMPAETAQLIEQLRWTVEDVARAFHYPVYKLGGPMPPYSSNLEVLNLGYYCDCLQVLIEQLELCLDEGLALPHGIGTEMDLDNLTRMDTAAIYDSNQKAKGTLTINEMRFRVNLPSVEGGDSVFLQQQEFSLAALAKRDAKEDPFETQSSKPEAPIPAVPVPQKQIESSTSRPVLEVYACTVSDLEAAGIDCVLA